MQHLALRTDGRLEFAIVLAGHGSDRLEERPHLAPFDVSLAGRPKIFATVSRWWLLRWLPIFLRLPCETGVQPLECLGANRASVSVAGACWETAGPPSANPGGPSGRSKARADPGAGEGAPRGPRLREGRSRPPRRGRASSRTRSTRSSHRRSQSTGDREPSQPIWPRSTLRRACVRHPSGGRGEPALLARLIDALSRLPDPPSTFCTGVGRFQFAISVAHAYTRPWSEHIFLRRNPCVNVCEYRSWRPSWSPWAHRRPSGHGSAGAAHSAAAPTVTILYGTAPDYLDPQEAYTTQGAEADWVSYLGLYTYAHKNGAAGSVVIPALATGAPKITNGGKTYTMTLRKDLKYSNGAAVKASDFAYSDRAGDQAELGRRPASTPATSSAPPPTRRARPRRSPGSRPTTPRGRSRSTCSLPTARSRTSSPSPRRAFVPTGTAMTNLTNNPPPGVGPYMITNVVPDQVVGRRDQPVLRQGGDPGDPGRQGRRSTRRSRATPRPRPRTCSATPPTCSTPATDRARRCCRRSRRNAPHRYSTTPVVQNFYFFLNTKAKPFDSQLVREAVTMSIDRNALSRARRRQPRSRAATSCRSG